MLVREIFRELSASEFGIIEAERRPCVLRGALIGWKWRACTSWDPARGGLGYLDGLAGHAQVEAMLSKGGMFYGDIRSHVPFPTTLGKILSLFRTATASGAELRSDDVECRLPTENWADIDPGSAHLYLAQSRIVTFRQQHGRGSGGSSILGLDGSNEDRTTLVDAGSGRATVGACQETGGATEYEQVPGSLAALMRDIEIPSLVARPREVNLWVSSQSSRSSLHYDPYQCLVHFLPLWLQPGVCRTFCAWSWAPSACSCTHRPTRRSYIRTRCTPSPATTAAWSLRHPISRGTRATGKHWNGGWRSLYEQGTRCFCPRDGGTSEACTIAVNIWWRSQLLEAIMRGTDDSSDQPTGTAAPVALTHERVGKEARPLDLFQVPVPRERHETESGSGCVDAARIAPPNGGSSAAMATVGQRMAGEELAGTSAGGNKTGVDGDHRGGEGIAGGRESTRRRGLKRKPEGPTDLAPPDVVRDQPSHGRHGKHLRREQGRTAAVPAAVDSREMQELPPGTPADPGRTMKEPLAGIRSRAAVWGALCPRERQALSAVVAALRSPPEPAGGGGGRQHERPAGGQGEPVVRGSSTEGAVGGRMLEDGDGTEAKGQPADSDDNRGSGAVGPATGTKPHEGDRERGVKKDGLGEVMAGGIPQDKVKSAAVAACAVPAATYAHTHPCSPEPPAHSPRGGRGHRDAAVPVVTPAAAAVEGSCAANVTHSGQVAVDMMPDRCRNDGPAGAHVLAAEAGGASGHRHGVPASAHSGAGSLAASLNSAGYQHKDVGAPVQCEMTQMTMGCCCFDLRQHQGAAEDACALWLAHGPCSCVELAPCRGQCGCDVCSDPSSSDNNLRGGGEGGVLSKGASVQECAGKDSGLGAVAGAHVAVCHGDDGSRGCISEPLHQHHVMMCPPDLFYPVFYSCFCADNLESSEGGGEGRSAGHGSMLKAAMTVLLDGREMFGKIAMDHVITCPQCRGCRKLGAPYDA
eukprot:jgi/Mesvir1/14334/Mv24244-RA.1